MTTMLTAWLILAFCWVILGVMWWRELDKRAEDDMHDMFHPDDPGDILTEQPLRPQDYPR